MLPAPELRLYGSGGVRDELARRRAAVIAPPGGATSGFARYSSVCSKYGEYTLTLYAAKIRICFFWNSSVGTGPRDKSSWKPRYRIAGQSRIVAR